MTGPSWPPSPGCWTAERLLVVFDDFEQNLTPGGGAFADPAIDEVITALADAAETGGLLVTCRYPLPGPDRFLARIPIPPLSAAELRRMFLRLPALADLDLEDRRLLMRTIGGHPRLIEFTDALLRGGRASLRHVQARLRDLARDHGHRPDARSAPGDRRWTRRCCWAAPTSCSPNCHGCSPPARRGAAPGRGLPCPDDPG